MTMLTLYFTLIDEKVDRVNFERIYNKYHDDILKRSYNILRNDADAKDALQETWISVLKNIDKIRDKDEGTVRAYIMTIAKNQSISILRKRKKEATLLSNIDSIELVDDSDLFALCEQEGVSRVLECINMLSEAQRDVILMYYLHHHSLKEIAKLFNVSEVVATSRWAHGRERLMKLLVRRGYYE